MECTQNGDPITRANDRGRGLNPKGRQIPQSPPNGLKGANNHPASGKGRHQRQHSNEGAKMHWLEESVTVTRTKCLNEIRFQDVLAANALYSDIQQYCMEVCTREEWGEGGGEEGGGEIKKKREKEREREGGRER